MNPNAEERKISSELQKPISIGRFVALIDTNKPTEEESDFTPDCGCDEMGPGCCDDVCGCDTD